MYHDPAEDEDQDDAWTHDTDSDIALRAATLGGSGVMPARSVGLYARWWQLETWLRELAYVELRALSGRAWTDAVKVATGRQNQDVRFTHMAGADNDNPLAYLDYSQLLEVLDRHWAQVGYALIERDSWDGRQADLKRIRHRIGHLRRPHRDDLARLEQTLRDLEQGAFRALASYNDRHTPDRVDDSDAVAVSWLGEQHPVAQRLIGHARREYDTLLLVRKSRRPWSAGDLSDSSQPGQLWHADVRLRGRYIDARALWSYDYVAAIRPLLVHLVADDCRRVGFTFSAADDGEAVADAIGHAFEAVLLVSRPGYPSQEQEERLLRRARDRPDFRFLADTTWNIVDETTLPISLFGAGAGVETNWS
jgi:hypothetical protein